MALFASPYSPTSPATPRTMVHPVPTPLCTGPSPGVPTSPHPHPAFRVTLKFFLSEAFSFWAVILPYSLPAPSTCQLGTHTACPVSGRFLEGVSRIDETWSGPWKKPGCSFAHACVCPQSLAQRLAHSQRSVTAEWVKGE